MKSLRILLVDDEAPIQEVMRNELTRLGHKVATCQDGHTAMRAMEKSVFDVAVLDLRMPGYSGIQILEHLKRVSPDTEAIMMTGHASMDTAIEAIRLGAMDYITKPAKMADIEAILLKVESKLDLKNQNTALKSRAQAAEGPNILVGDHPSIAAVNQLINTIAPTESTVLILGETGTGKELAARTIYMRSLRAGGPFIPVNCGALSEHLVESELFGHRKGAFTGAEQNHKGLFEVANGGTLFLDEVGELSKNLQVKLLRFLESGEIRRVGENEPFRTNVRVLCATNRDLRTMVARDEFREDLYFRVNTFEIRMPSLRERVNDIPALALHLLSRAANKPIEQIAPMVSIEALQALMAYRWSGNVRELWNVMQYAWVMAAASGGLILPVHLPGYILAPAVMPQPMNPGVLSGQMMPAQGMPGQVYHTHPQAGYHHAAQVEAPKSLTLEEMEREQILRVLDKHRGNKPAVAAELGISLKTLYNKLNRYAELGGVPGLT